MRASLPFSACVVGAALMSSAAAAAPVHLVASSGVSRAALEGTAAVDPSLRPEEQAAVSKALLHAGLRVVAADAPHAQEVTLRVRARPLCTSACSVLTGYNVGPLADHYRRVLVLAGRPAAGRRVPLDWYVELWSDGLSDREMDYLPAMLDYGGSVIARSGSAQAAAPGA